jgi:hypothetical protein
MGKEYPSPGMAKLLTIESDGQRARPTDLPFRPRDRIWISKAEWPYALKKLGYRDVDFESRQV